MLQEGDLRKMLNSRVVGKSISKFATAFTLAPFISGGYC
jgi:dsRNA-specific ribonuclease